MSEGGTLSKTEGWYVYIIECSDKSLYTGITSNIEHRIKDHNSGKGCRYTRSRLPVKLVYTEICRTKSQVLKREAQLKKWTRVKKNALIKQNYKRLKRLSRCSK